MDGLIYWIWLSRACTVDTGTFSKLASELGDAESIYKADESAIIKCIGKRISDRERLINKDLTEAEEIYAFCRKHSVGILTYADKAYPDKLRKIPTPPVLLYYRGTLPDFNRSLSVASVGTRDLSEYGRKCAFKISYDLATAGAIIVSGMAMGIDGVCLAGAISAEKPTVAVLGSGIDICYPSQHLTLAREIVKKGCILTEYPPKTPPSKFNFPKRNRIISGLSDATLVYEGRERSGSLITARYAKEQERKIFALPSNVDSEAGEGTALLLKNGALPFTKAEDILSHFEKDYPHGINAFLLKDRLPMDMMYVLRSLEVVANCPSDDIYNQPWIIKRTRKSDNKSDASGNEVLSRQFPSEERAEHKSEPLIASEKEKSEKRTNNGESTTAQIPFDKRSLDLYKKIPPKGAIEIEELCSDGAPLKDVMRMLMRLEAGGFTVNLPGGKVMRKSK